MPLGLYNDCFYYDAKFKLLPAIHNYIKNQIAIGLQAEELCYKIRSHEKRFPFGEYYRQQFKVFENIA